MPTIRDFIEAQKNSGRVAQTMRAIYQNPKHEAIRKQLEAENEKDSNTPK